jgi:fatty acid desaturase 2 (delta-6 desaturase)
MGRGSRNFTEPENKSAFTGTCVSKSYFTRKEVLRHNNRNDLWIIIDNKVYNVTEFQRNHPGGSKILKLYAGEDATEVFNAFHKDFDKINRYLKIYCIGNLNPNDLLNSETKLQSLNNRSADKIRELERLQKLKEMKKDLAVLRKTLEEMGLFNPSYTFFFLQAFHIVFFQVLGFYILWNYSYGILPLLSALICHVIAQAQAAWTQHDYGHSSIFKKPKHNQWVQTFFLGVIKGACAEWWTYLHNQHHAKPNVVSSGKSKC